MYTVQQLGPYRGDRAASKVRCRSPLNAKSVASSLLTALGVRSYTRTQVADLPIRGLVTAILYRITFLYRLSCTGVDTVLPSSSEVVHPNAKLARLREC